MGRKQNQFEEIKARLLEWSIPDESIDTVHDAARASLNEVKALTEYEDGKMSRLLTVIAFLSAVVAAIFTRFASEYVWPTFGSYSSTLSWWLPFGAYATFFLYIAVVTAAVLVLLVALGPRFNVPLSWKQQGSVGENALPSSMLFYRGILDVGGRQWAEAFIYQSVDKARALKAHYAKCYIGEAYLVAEKVAVKLKMADPGVIALRWAMVLLLVFFSLFVLTAQLVPPTR